MIRRLLVIAAAVLASIVVVPAAQAQATTAQAPADDLACGTTAYCTFTWYADMSMTMFEGYMIIDCQDNYYISGNIFNGYLFLLKTPC